MLLLEQNSSGINYNRRNNNFKEIPLTCMEHSLTKNSKIKYMCVLESDSSSLKR